MLLLLQSSTAVLPAIDTAARTLENEFEFAMRGNHHCQPQGNFKRTSIYTAVLYIIELLIEQN